MVEPLTVAVIVAAWCTLVWLATYMYMSRRVNSLVDSLNFLESEYGDLIDDYEQHRYDDYVDYELNENGHWYESRRGRY